MLPESEDMTCKHEITERRSPAAILILCTCGWSRAVLRRQNALARASKVRAARAEHEREIEAERKAKVSLQ
jgi:hypothetical protein